MVGSREDCKKRIIIIEKIKTHTPLNLFRLIPPKDIVVKNCKQSVCKNKKPKTIIIRCVRYSDSKDISVCAIWWSQHDCFPSRPKVKNRKINEFPSSFDCPPLEKKSIFGDFWNLKKKNKNRRKKKRESSDWFNSGRILVLAIDWPLNSVTFCLFCFWNGDLRETQSYDKYKTNGFSIPTFWYLNASVVQLHTDQQW